MISIYTGGHHVLLENLSSEAYESQKGGDHKERKHITTFKLRDVVSLKRGNINLCQNNLFKWILKHT